MSAFCAGSICRRAFYEGQSGTGGTAERHLLRPPALAELRLDGALVLLLLAVSFRLYGAPLGESRQGYNARPPLGLSVLLLNANYHGVHHNAPDLSWRDLPRRFAAESRRYDKSVLACLARQFAGPVPALGFLRPVGRRPVSLWNFYAIRGKQDPTVPKITDSAPCRSRRSPRP